MINSDGQTMIKSGDPTRGNVGPDLPPRPSELARDRVAVWEADLVMPTYHPDDPPEHPEFLSQRVYQGSSGSVYPMPLYESIATEPVDHAWHGVHLENDWLRLVVLPELGGRIHIGHDRVRDHHFFHRNDVIKPALVGLAGPWIAGGVEFNWPQHHRPATYLPTEWLIEHDDDGAVTVWCSDHDPLTRMKGMHGIKLHPDRAVIELLVRLHNRTDVTQTFLWWANVAARVDEHYQSFFPTDVNFVADHANRATTAFPAADRPYYGVDYAARVTPEHPDADRLDWYRNIDVPTSYMVLDTDDEFFGGYDHRRKAGFVHWASKEVSPGKKQWTWGNHEFGWAWDRALFDDGAHYIELMAGVHTNNQPDFTFLRPGETKTFTQLWYPIGELGAVQQATPEAAMGIETVNGGVRIAVQSTCPLTDLSVELLRGDEVVQTWVIASLEPSIPVVLTTDEALAAFGDDDLSARLVRDGRLLLQASRASTSPQRDGFEVPPPAREPDAPTDVASSDQLWLIGSHLDQYRHATRSPELWWAEALRRDPGDLRSNTSMGLRRFRAGDFAGAERHLQAAVDRSNTHNLNPASGEAHYLLGLTLARQGRGPQARPLLARASWDQPWWAPAHVALARLDLVEGDDRAAATRLLDVIDAEPRRCVARNLAAVALTNLGRAAEATEILAGTLAQDPLDPWARVLAGDTPHLDPVTWLDVAKEFQRCGQWQQALDALDRADAAPHVVGMTGVAPLVALHRAWALERLSRPADEALVASLETDPRWALAIDHDDLAVLQWAVDRHEQHWLAHSLLGSWWRHWRRPDLAEDHWRRSFEAHPTAVTARALGLLVHNEHVAERGQGAVDEAWSLFEGARELAPDDAKLLAEQDSLAELRGDSVQTRLERLGERLDLVESRHDLAARHAGLMVVAGRSSEALSALRSRQFQVWEGGEGLALAVWEVASLAEAAREPNEAIELIEAALRPPTSLGEDRHLLANPAHLWLALGDARAAAGDPAGAEVAWQRAATVSGDFRQMATTEHSDLTAFQVVALRRLGRLDEADALIGELEAFTDRLAATPAAIDFFATSLPQLKLFVRDLDEIRDEQVAVLRAQLDLLRGSTDEGPAPSGQAWRVAVEQQPHHLLLWWSGQVLARPRAAQAARGPGNQAGGESDA